MPVKAKSITDQKHIISKIKDELEKEAVGLYLHKQSRPADRDKPRMGYQAVCDVVMKDYRERTGDSSNLVKLNHNTIRNRVAGMPSIRDSNAAKNWLTAEEEKIIIDYMLECADRGFPLSHRRLREHVDQILFARIGSNFSGVGNKWTYHFVAAHQEQLKTACSRPLEALCGQAVHENNHNAWFDLLEKELEGVVPECIWAADESGFQPGLGGAREQVIGRAGHGAPRQQVDGNRENITVIVTFCADGTSIAPAVVYKGSV